MSLIIAKFFASCLFLMVGLACAETITGKVIGVMDGDTIEVLDATKTPRRIRLEGIDAPEKAQPFGARYKQHLSDQVFGKPVEVLSNKTDKYGRTVGKVVIGGKDANLEQVRSGFAWHYKEYQKEQSASDRAAYANAETSARNMKSGLWNDPKPIPPWEWRHGGKSQPTAQSSASDCPCGGATFCSGSRGGQYWHVAKRRKTLENLDDGWQKDLAQAYEKLKARIRAYVEHPFHVVKNIFKYEKTRYKGLAKNDAQLNVLFALAADVDFVYRCRAVWVREAYLPVGRWG